MLIICFIMLRQRACSARACWPVENTPCVCRMVCAVMDKETVLWVMMSGSVTSPVLLDVPVVVWSTTVVVCLWWHHLQVSPARYGA